MSLKFPESPHKIDCLAGCFCVGANCLMPTAYYLPASEFRLVLYCYGRIGAILLWSDWCYTAMVGLVLYCYGRIGATAMVGLVLYCYGRTGAILLWSDWCYTAMVCGGGRDQPSNMLMGEA